MGASRLKFRRSSKISVGVPAAAYAYFRKRAGKLVQQPLGNHANFVINFCQILFESETAKIAQGE
jgi:hypothetical protein